MFKNNYFFYFLSDAFLKLSFGLIFFNYGYGKLSSLLSGNSEGLVNMVSSIPFFNNFPFFFSWALALGEIGVLIALFYGLFYSLPFSNLVTKIAGIMSLVISLVIVYQHIFAWGDNIFSYGPFEIFNAKEGKKPIFGQFLFIPISIYIIFSNKNNYNLVNDTK
ncbi:MAG: hypothetical protein CMJ13_04040 [Pelagibacterales bacterium]|nr:hypothetical protein [Pelagibacterales bacterium]|tara:strand:- start:1588 stop:2076 length:489 start_codon:yes stop_codon:yes gene_type:complete